MDRQESPWVLPWVTLCVFAASRVQVAVVNQLEEPFDRFLISTALVLVTVCLIFGVGRLLRIMPLLTGLKEALKSQRHYARGTVWPLKTSLAIIVMIVLGFQLWYNLEGYRSFGGSTKELFGFFHWSVLGGYVIYGKTVNLYPSGNWLDKAINYDRWYIDYSEYR